LIGPLPNHHPPHPHFSSSLFFLQEEENEIRRKIDVVSGERERRPLLPSSLGGLEKEW